MNLRLWIGVVVLLVLAAAVLAFWRWPLEIFAWQRRRALARVTERQEMEGPQGPLRYFTAGSGPVTVFLHGAGDHAGSWAGVVAALLASEEKRAGRLLVPDLPGHGGSAPRGGPGSLAEVLAGLEALLDREAPGEPVTLVGNSMGGWVALLYAERHPERVALLVLEDAGGIGAIAVSLQPANRRQAARLMDAVLGPDTPRPAGFVLDNLVRRTSRGPIARLAAADATPFILEGRLGEIDVPARVIWGEDDGVLPLAVGRRMVEQLPRAELQTIPRCGHVPHAECTERFVAVLEEALGAPR